VAVHLCLAAAGARAAGGEALIRDLPLVEEVNCGSANDPHPFAESEPGASRVEQILGRPCRVLPNEAGGAKYFAYRLGQGGRLRPGAAYLLSVEYPEDRPRSMFVLNRGCETPRGFHTGRTVGDVAVGLTDNVLESLRIPLSGRYETWRMLFFMHDRFPGLQMPRGELARPDPVESGFWVVIAQPPARQAPASDGAAVSRIRLFEVPDLNALYLPLRLPPRGLPRRHIFWREEMSDGVVQATAEGERGLDDPVEWYEQKARLARFLGINTFSKDLLEFGHNQGWDSAPHGANEWVYQTPYPERWGQILEVVGRHGLDVLPYYEYAGSIGGSRALGSQKRCLPLSGERDYTDIHWCENANADVTDPDTLRDVTRVLDATVTRHAAKAHFAGAWFRTRPSHMPVSFSDRCLELFSAHAGQPEPVTRERLREDEELLGAYHSWWFARRREFLVAVRDYLRGEVNPRAVVLFTPFPQEPGPPLIPNHRVVVTDDVDYWKPRLMDLWGWTITPRGYDTVVGDGLYADVLERWPRDWQQWEHSHASPPADPDRYRDTEGVLLTYPFHRAYSVAAPEMLAAFHGASGLAIVRHYSLNENTMEGKVGYFVSDMERAGPYCMLSEVRAMAHGDPRYIGYLSAASFNRGFPQHVRAFNAAFLSLPALPSVVDEGACEEANVVVRTIEAGEHGIYLAVVNVGIEALEDVRVRLPRADGQVTDAATGEALASPDGVVRLSLGPCSLRALHVLPAP
jgi:hypothetical protein